MQRLKDRLPNSWGQLLDEGIGLWGPDHEDYQMWLNYDETSSVVTLMWETRLYELLLKEYTTYRHEQIYSKIYLKRCPIPTDVHCIILSFLTPCPALPNRHWTQHYCVETFIRHKSMSYGLVMLKTMGYDFSTFYYINMTQHLIITCFKTKQHEKARFLLKNGIKPGFDGGSSEEPLHPNNFSPPLIWTIQNDRYGINQDDFFKRLDMLLEFGVDVNEGDRNSQTPIQHELYTMLNTFFDEIQPIDINKCDMFKQKPKDECDDKEEYEWEMKRHKELIQKKTNIERWNGIKRQHWDVIERLIFAGADIYKKDCLKQNAVSDKSFWRFQRNFCFYDINTDVIFKRLIELDKKYKGNKRRRLF